jgi:SAM-dependent methyltransferase
LNPEAMKLFGQALLDYHNGDIEAAVTLKRDDGRRINRPMKMFFRDAKEYPLEKVALDLCHGRVLDVGAGSGLHSLFLQDKGLEVTAIDISPDAVQVMRERGVVKAHLADIMSFEGGRFDTVLLMANNIGLAETIDCLGPLLRHISDLLGYRGQVLLTSSDWRSSSDPTDKEYQRQNSESGRYFGEARMTLIYRGLEGPLFGWMNVDPETLSDHASTAGLNCEVLGQHDDGGYVARLTHRQGVVDR